MMKSKFKSELGETQIGIIAIAMALGVACWALFALEGCIREHKDGKVQRRNETIKQRSKNKVSERRNRKPGGYSLKVN